MNDARPAAAEEPSVATMEDLIKVRRNYQPDPPGRRPISRTPNGTVTYYHRDDEYRVSVTVPEDIEKKSAEARAAITSRLMEEIADDEAQNNAEEDDVRKVRARIDKAQAEMSKLMTDKRKRDRNIALRQYVLQKIVGTPRAF